MYCEIMRIFNFHEADKLLIFWGEHFILMNKVVWGKNN